MSCPGGVVEIWTETYEREWCFQLVALMMHGLLYMGCQWIVT